MKQYIDEFIEYIRYERNYSDYTETNYTLDLDLYEEYLNIKKINYKNITYKNIQLYITYLKEEKKLKPSSINRHLSCLRSFYNFLLKENIIIQNPFKLVSSQKKDKKLPNYMKYSEFEALVEVCDETDLGIRNRTLIELLFATGARIGELINVKLNDINFSNKEIKLTGKGNKQRLCFFNSYSEEYLKKYINSSRVNLLNGKNSEYLFINHIGGNLTDRGVRDILDKMIKKASINTKITPHSFRHTFATMLLNEGCDLKSVQELLGHVNLSTTSIYTHLTNDRIKDVYLHTHPRSKK